MLKQIVPILVLVVLLVGLTGYAQRTTYEEFYKQLVTSQAEEIQKDAILLDQLLTQWSEGETTQSAVVSKLEEMEQKAQSYFHEILRLRAPEGKFEKHKQSVYVFSTWSTIIGMFREGLADIDRRKLEAASVLSEYFQRRTDAFGGPTEESESYED